MMVTLYGIPNCQTVKKAQTWLAENGIDFLFVNFKKEAPTREQIQQWLKDVPVEILINKKGTTWRKLTDEDKDKAQTEEGAINLMIQNPSVIKRPVLTRTDQPTCVGFSEQDYQNHFQK